MEIFLHYISIPIGFIFILIGIKTKHMNIRIFKINTNSQTIFILTGIFLILLAFPVANFIAEIQKVVPSK